MAELEATLIPVMNSILSVISGDEFKDLGRKVDDIKDHLGSLRDYLLSVEAGGQAGNDPARWREMKSVVYDIDDLLDVYAYDVKFTQLNNTTVWHKLLALNFPFRGSKPDKHISRLTPLLYKLEQSFRGPTPSSIPIQKHCDNISPPPPPQIVVVGRDKERLEIVNNILALRDSPSPCPSVVAVLGISGIGKTTLAKLVYQDLGIKDCFDIMLWVSPLPLVNMSDDSTIRMLQAIVEAATGEYVSNESKMNLISKIRSKLDNRRCLLVLDDVWVESRHFWMDMMRILHVAKEGSVILITTTSRAVASTANSVQVYELKALSDSDCWSIFKGLALSEGEEEQYPMLSEIGKSLARKCCGVPLLAVGLGGLLRSNRDISEWLRIDKMDLSTLHEVGPFAIVKTPYDNLPSYLKPCFSFLALSQRGARVVSRHQIFVWSALGLLGSRDGKDEIESCGQTYLMELLSRSILHDPMWTSEKRIVSFKMHDLFHTLAMEVLGEDLAIITWNEINVSALSRHIVWGYEEPDALSDKGFPQELLKARKARTFRFGYDMGRVSKSFVNGIISNLCCLYILDLGYSRFENLPSSVGDLKHLRVLNISFNTIINSLPRTICKLLNLQAFYLEGCTQLRSLPEMVYNLVSLKCFIVTTSQWSLVGTQFNCMPALQELQFYSCEKIVSLWENDNIGRLISLRRLQFHNCPKLASLPNSMSLLVNLKELVISNCQQLDLREGEGLRKLVSLQSLEISKLPRLTCLPHDIQSAATSLQYLLLGDCEGLVMLPNWLQSFTYLQSFVIHSCSGLLTLPEGFHHMKSLNELNIENCRNLSRWCESPAGYFLIEHIRKIEIDGHLIVHNKKEKLSSFKDDEGSTGIQISQFDPDSISSLPYKSKLHTPGYFPIKLIRKIEIDGHLIVHNKKEKLSSFKDDEGSTGIQISQYDPDSISSSPDKSKLHTPGVLVSRWQILALAFKAIFKLRLLLNEAYKSRDFLKHYCCLFPIDYGFERDTLVELWMASGYLTNECMEESAKRYFDILLNEEYIVPLQHLPSASNAILRNDILLGKCEYTLNVEKDVDAFDEDLYIVLRDENMEGDVTKRQHVSVVSKYINKTTFETLKKCHKLRTLLFICNYGTALQQIPSDLFLTLECMESLDLSGSHIKELPGSIGNVTQLHYLDLSFTLIERLPETIDRLLKLQTLKLKGCNKLCTLPKGMKKLISLRHLYFDVLGQLSVMPRGIGVLTKLRTLSAFIVHDDEGRNISELTNMNNLSGDFCISGLENIRHSDVSDVGKSVLLDKMHLTQIQLRWDEGGTTIEDDFSLPMWYLEPHSCLVKLEVFYYPNPRLPCWICKEKFQNLTSITFLKCENTKLDVCIGLLPNLKCLNIIKMNRVETIGRLVDGDSCASFPKLEKLVIDGMLNLASWSDVQNGDFPSLSEVSLKHCPQIRAFPFLAFLGSLENLEITHCTALESVSDGILSKKLKTLAIDSCPLLNKKCSLDGEDWYKIVHVPQIYVDLENMHSPSEDGHHSDSEDTEEDEASENGKLGIL